MEQSPQTTPSASTHKTVREVIIQYEFEWILLRQERNLLDRTVAIKMVPETFSSDSRRLLRIQDKTSLWFSLSLLSPATKMLKQNMQTSSRISLMHLLIDSISLMHNAR